MPNRLPPGQAIRPHRPEAAWTQGEHVDGAGWKRAGARTSRSPKSDTGRDDSHHERQRARSSKSPLSESARNRGGGDSIRKETRASSKPGKTEARASSKPASERGFSPSAVELGSVGERHSVDRGLLGRGLIEEHGTERWGQVKDVLRVPRVDTDLSRSMSVDAQCMEVDPAVQDGSMDTFVCRGSATGDQEHAIRSSQRPDLHHTRPSVSETNVFGRKVSEAAISRLEPDSESRRVPFKAPRLEHSAGRNVEKSLAGGNSSGGQVDNVQQQRTELSTISGPALGGLHKSDRRCAQGCETGEIASLESRIVKSDQMKLAQSDVQPNSQGDTSLGMVGVGMVLEPEVPGDEGLCYVSDVKAGGPLDHCGKVQVMDRLWAVDEFRCFGSTRSEIRNHVMGR